MKEFTDLVMAFQMDLDHYDPWGSTMEWFFTVSHLIHHKFGLENIPEIWEYRPSPLDHELDLEEYHLIEHWDLLEYSMESLVKLGNILDLYADELRKTGRSY